MKYLGFLRTHALLLVIFLEAEYYEKLTFFAPNDEFMRGGSYKIIVISHRMKENSFFQKTGAVWANYLAGCEVLDRNTCEVGRDA